MTNFIEVRKVKTRFMNGNLDVNGDIYDYLRGEYGMADMIKNHVDHSEAIYSDGFVNAFNNGRMPILGSEVLSFEPHKRDDEYHHVIVGDNCYRMYFKEEE